MESGGYPARSQKHSQRLRRPSVKEAFKISEEVDVCCLLALGYTAEPFKKYGGRSGVEQVCFGESYGEKFEL